MIQRGGLVLDANILLRAVFGERVRYILEKYEDRAFFWCPDVCFRDANAYIPEICARKKIDVDLALSVFDQVSTIVEPVDVSLYEECEQAARQRMQHRDVDDWPIAAVALLLQLPIWTEDQDFFGSGIPVWTTDRVEIFLNAIPPR